MEISFETLSHDEWQSFASAEIKIYELIIKRS